MRITRQALGMMVLAGFMAGCAALTQSPGRIAAPSDVTPPPILVGAGLPTQPAEPWLSAPAMLASAISVPVHGVACAASAGVGGLFYAFFFHTDYAEDVKGWVAQNCAGPYVVTPAELAAVPQPFPVRGLRTPRMGTLPVEEAVRQAVPR